MVHGKVNITRMSLRKSQAVGMTLTRMTATAAICSPLGAYALDILVHLCGGPMARASR